MSLRRLIYLLPLWLFGQVIYAKPALDSLKQSGDSRYKSMQALSKALYYIEKMYVDEDQASVDKLVSNALAGLVSDLDPHSSILTKEEYISMHQGKKQFGGIGIEVSYEDNKIIVISPIEGSPAMRAGVRSGDEIVAIDGVQVTKLGTKQAIEKMKDTPGTRVKLTIKRKGEAKLLKFEMVREVIRVRSVRSFQLSDDVLVVRIASFTRNVAKDLNAILKKNKEKLAGLILDLRDNPGGLLGEAVAVSDTFLSSGLIVSTVGRDSTQIEREFASFHGTYEGFPLVVLVNEGSASASEIVAGALQDHRRAIVLGGKTFGKGSVQTLVNLPDGSALKLTIARYYTPLDRSIQAVGITPDIIVNRRKARAAHPVPIRREVDLEGHIESEDLSDLSQGHSISHAIRKWPKPIQKDYQLVTAFSYLQGWAMFDWHKKQFKTSPAIDQSQISMSEK